MPPAKEMFKSESEELQKSTAFLPKWESKRIFSQEDEVSMPLEATREVSFQLLSPSFTMAFQQLLEDFFKFICMGSPPLLLQLQRKLKKNIH